MTEFWEIKPMSRSSQGRGEDRSALDRDLRASVMLAALKAAAEFLEDEADNRAAAGSEMSDYEREPRDVLDQVQAAIKLAEGRS